MDNIPWVLAGIGLILSIVSPIIVWWGSSRYFTGQFEQWKENVRERFDRLQQRIEGIEAMKVRLEDARTEIKELRQIKHEIGGLKSGLSLLKDLIIEGLKKG